MHHSDGPRRSRSRRDRYAVAVLCVPFGVGCADPPPLALQAVVLPDVVRIGSPLQVTGVGLAGARLQLTDAPVDVALTVTSTDATGTQTALGTIADSPAWRPGQRIAAACLVGPELAQWQPCLTVQARFRSDWVAGSVAISTPVPAVRWGTALQVRAEDLLLPGEGSQVLDIDDGVTTTTAPIATQLATGRTIASVTVTPNWSGPPGQKTWRVRLRGVHRGQASTGPWSPAMALTLAPPSLLPAAGPMRRGEIVPLQIRGLPADAQLLFAGTWATAARQPVIWATDPAHALIAQADNAAVANTVWWWAQFPAGQPQPHHFAGTVTVAVATPAWQWQAPPLAVDWAVGSTVQHVRLVLGAGWHAALARLGLDAQSQMIKAQMLQRLQDLFVGIALDFDTGPPQQEAVTLGFFDKDPNGLNLLGAEPYVGKDTGNLQLDEQLLGVNFAARRAGQAAYGGVFLGEIVGFSHALAPNAPLATPQFDALLGPYCPALGGHPAASGPADATVTAAVRAVAFVAAEIAAHELGHALGLAAGTADPHHAGDHPGWIMDAGQVRPFAERAGLAGAASSQWGPVDSAYLQAILPPPGP